MAIPISLPSPDDVEDSYRTLDSLLEQLLIAVRQVLVHRRQQQQDLSTFTMSRQRNTNSNVTVTSTTEDNYHQQQQQQRCGFTAMERSDLLTPSTPQHPRLPLPDLIPESASFECTEHRRKDVSAAASLETPVSTTISTWVQVGCDLRLIADNFRTERAPQQNVEGKCSRTKEASLVSLLCPAFGKSIWTTVALLLGWGIFSRTR